MNSTSTTTTQTVAFCTFCPKLSTNGIFAVIFFSVVAIGVCGNIFVATVILTDRKLLHASVNLFLLNLAIADLGNLLCCSPDIALVLYASGWLLPHFLCPVLRFLQEYFLYASVLMQASRSSVFR
ncbi:hypothetical protein AB6A40_003134 [Gnathostoma spinigerum]|uniref:G-protein coupled receptors family 1 profile domain-containing protein n=1 Tax=Gnathostoma spinigerum TaxID=75299 RepID=A0ABD6EJG6_9BILA